jgi:hypothetical protein
MDIIKYFLIIVMKLISVEPTPVNSDKKYIATFCKCNGPTKCLPKDRKKIQFGSKGSTTFTSGATEQQKDAYIARHKVNEDWTKIGPASLSRFILWSKKTLEGGIQEFKKRFHC